MAIGDDFKTFCDKIAVQDVESIRYRYKRLTKQLNKDFWSLESETAHSIYAGSFGRGTATEKTSDIDMVFWLPSKYWEIYDEYSGNGQSAMLQAVRNSIKNTYSSSAIGADGQIVYVNFDDDRRFEVLPAFELTDDSFRYPDSNDGGSWKNTNPRPEKKAMVERDSECNGNLRLLCRMMRHWRLTWNADISGLLIDTLAYNFLENYENKAKSFVYYDWISRDFLKYLSDQDRDKKYWLSPGARQQVYRIGSFERKASTSYDVALQAIAVYDKEKPAAGRAKWREIYGNSFPN